jgi:hypothetical protein
MMKGRGLAIVSHDIPVADPPLQLTHPDSSYVSFRIASTPYDQIIYDLYLFQDTYQLILDSGAEPQPPSPSPAPPDNNEGSTDGGSDNSSNNPPPPANDTPDSGASADEGDDEADNNDDTDDPDDEQNPDDDDEQNPDDDSDESGDDHGEKNKEKKNKDKKKNKGKKGDNDRSGQRVKDPAVLTVNLDHFFQNARPSLVVFGTYNNNSQPLEIIFVVTGKEKLTLQSTQGENILNPGQNLMEAVFDPEAWFAPISTADIESAQRQTYQGREVLFIHQEINSNLYETLLTQFESSARLTVRTPPAP